MATSNHIEEPSTYGILSELILSAGGVTRLAEYLGVETRAVTDWRRAGQISRIGAILVSKSKVLSRLFNIFDLRPDMDDAAISRVVTHQYYKEARLRQIKFESGSGLKSSQLYYLQTRLGVLSEGANGR